MKILGLKSVRVGEKNDTGVKAGEKIPFVFTFTRRPEKGEKLEVICQIHEKKFDLHKVYGTYILSSALSDESKPSWSFLNEERLCESKPIYLTFSEELAGATLDISFSLKYPFPASGKGRFTDWQVLYADPSLFFQAVSVNVQSSQGGPKIEALYWSDTKEIEYGKLSTARMAALHKNETVYLHIHTRGLFGRQIECKSSGSTGSPFMASRIETIRNNVLSVAYTFYNDDVDEISTKCTPLLSFPFEREALTKTVTIPYIKDSEIVLSSRAMQVYAGPGSPKKAHYASQAECRVDFRPGKDYDGSFGFSWYRTGDTSDYDTGEATTYGRTKQRFFCNYCNDHPFSDKDYPEDGIMGKHYETVKQGREANNVVVRDGNKSGTGTGVRYTRLGGRDNFVADNIMADDHKKDYLKISLFGYPKSKPRMREYLVPVMTLSCGKEVELQLFLHVMSTPKKILFVFDNFRAETDEILSVEAIPPILSPAVTSRRPNFSHRIQITCHKPFDKELLLKAYAVPANAKEGMVKKQNGRLMLFPQEGCPLVLPELCGMLHILPNDEAHWREIKVVFFSVRTNINGNPLKGIEDTAAFSEKLGQLNKYLSQAYVKAEGVFEEIDLTTNKADQMAYQNACFYEPNEKTYCIKQETRSSQLEPLLRSKIPSKYDESSEYICLFFFPEICMPQNNTKNTRSRGYSAPWKNGKSLQFIVCFGDAEETTSVHELFHVLGLPHTFDGSSPRSRYTYEDGKTDNLMDYSHRVGVERKSLFEWQWEAINIMINQ